MASRKCGQRCGHSRKAMAERRLIAFLVSKWGCDDCNLEMTDMDRVRKAARISSGNNVQGWDDLSKCTSRM